MTEEKQKDAAEAAEKETVLKQLPLTAVEKKVNVEFTGTFTSRDEVLYNINTLVSVLNARVAYPKFAENLASGKAKKNPITGSVELSPLSNQQADAIHSKIIDLINKL